MIGSNIHARRAANRAYGLYLLKQGAPRKSVAQFLGVSQPTVNDWKRLAIRQEMERLSNAYEPRVRRAPAIFTDHQDPNNPNGPAILVNGRFVRDRTISGVLS